MASYYKTKKIITEINYVLETPTNWVEVSKVFSAIKQDLNSAGYKEFDDTVKVESQEGQMVFTYVKDIQNEHI